MVGREPDTELGVSKFGFGRDAALSTFQFANGQVASFSAIGSSAHWPKQLGRELCGLLGGACGG